MKIYHKFLLYQNKWIHPYTRIILGGVTYIAYLASILLIMGVVYEHGFTISELLNCKHSIGLYGVFSCPKSLCACYWNTGTQSVLLRN